TKDLTMKPDTLVIQTQPAQKLSSQQRKFNSYIKKVETLERDLARFNTKLGGALAYYIKDILPLVQEKKRAQKNLLRVFYDFLHKPKFLRPAQKRTLKTLMQNIMNELLNDSKEPEDDIKKIFLAIFGISYEQAKEQAFEDIKMDMKDMFDEMGVAMELDFLNHNMTEEEIAQYMNRMRAEMQSKEEEKKRQAFANPKGETKAQIKERLAKEAQDKSISIIYKGLAKALHPDLEQDQSKKGQKEELMKKVTVAYQKKDLHTLLKLELEILYSEERSIDKLSNEKIKAYNDLLREQVEELQMQIDMLPEHPRYSPLLAFVHAPRDLFSLNLDTKPTELKYSIQGIKESLTALQQDEKSVEEELRAILKVADYAQKIAKKRDEYMVSQMDFGDSRF
ncbi:MAG: hypothetical protein ORN54_07680, partial [Cyclobacteriaceae bacterium]|nr:hypothetical protein [Cyclobacteriaceae bacterium]